MTTPRRWIDEDATPAERRLLMSARGDAPPSGSRERMFAVLGVGGATVLGAAAVTAAQLPTAAALAASGAAALGKAAPSGAGMTALVIMKWVGVGAVAGLVTTGGVRLMSERAAGLHATPVANAAAQPVPQAARVEAAPARPAMEVLPESIVPPPPPEPELEAVPEPARPANPVRAQQRPRVEPLQRATPNVGKEVKTLDRAREALAAGDAPRALQELGHHDAEFASGALGPEAEVLRIDALLARGEYNSAAVMARGFLFKHPSSPHLRRVRALLARAKAAEAPPAAAD